MRRGRSRNRSSAPATSGNGVPFGTVSLVAIGHTSVVHRELQSREVEMTIDDDGAPDDQQSRLDALIDEFKQAQRRRLVKRGLALLNDTTADLPMEKVAKVPFEKLN